MPPSSSSARSTLRRAGSHEGVAASPVVALDRAPRLGAAPHRCRGGDAAVSSAPSMVRRTTEPDPTLGGLGGKVMTP
jgi:hypothetical protein